MNSDCWFQGFTWLDEEGQIQLNAVLKYDYKIKVTNHLGRVNAKADTINLFNSLIFPQDQANKFVYQNPGAPPNSNKA